MATNNVQLDAYDSLRAAEQARIDQREQMLQKEYSDIEKRTGPAGLKAAHDFLTGLGPEVVYNAETPDDHLRAASRSLRLGETRKLGPCARGWQGPPREAMVSTCGSEFPFGTSR
jgi:hypothetical protein